MAIVSSRKAIHLKDIDRLNQKRTQILDNVCIVKYSDRHKVLSKRSSVVLHALHCRSFVVNNVDNVDLWYKDTTCDKPVEVWDFTCENEKEMISSKLKGVQV